MGPPKTFTERAGRTPSMITVYNMKSKLLNWLRGLRVRQLTFFEKGVLKKLLDTGISEEEAIDTLNAYVQTYSDGQTRILREGS